MKEQRGIGRTVVASTIQSAVRTVERWKATNVQNMAYLGAIPDDLRLVPQTGRRAVEHAWVMNAEAAVALSSALDDLRDAEIALQVTRRLQGRPAHELDRQCEQVREYLGSAELSLHQARELLAGEGRAEPAP